MALVVLLQPEHYLTGAARRSGPNERECHMEIYPLHSEIVARFNQMPRQLQMAGRYILENPQDVALLSMRDQARKAGVQPATMTRLAQFLGLPGYDRVRAIYHEAIRDRSTGFAEKARQQIRDQALEGDTALAARMFARLSHQIDGLSHPEVLASLATVANALTGARRIYCLGQRSCHPVMWHFNYMISLLGERTVLVDGAAGTGSDALTWAKEGDVLFVLTISPYAAITLQICEYAKSRGLKIVAITDSEVAPIRAVADSVLFCPTDSLSFFHTMTPAFALSEVLASMLAGKPEMHAHEALQQTEARLNALSTYSRS
jgi:DNA-binding MurR/RpiR family transcriptional regulator